VRSGTRSARNSRRWRDEDATLVRTRDWGVIAWRLAILVGFIGAWQWLTGIKAISKTPGLYWIDPFFISRPSAIAERFVYLMSPKVRLGIWQMALSTVQT